MTPADIAKLLALLERIAVALEKGGSGASGQGGGAGWRSMLVPKWAKFDAGKPFGELNDKGLAFWVSGYVPKRFEKRDGTVVPPSAVDVALRKALDQAAKELGLPLPPGYAPETASTPKESAPPPRSPAPSPEIEDSEVPL